MNCPVWWPEAEVDLNLHVSTFADRLKSKLENLNPSQLISRKNPYLFCLRAANNTEQFSSSILDAFLSSSEETMFGALAELCAVEICKHAKNGMKSATEGIDIEYTGAGVRTIVQVKSGKNWGNSSQHSKMKDYFSKARQILQQGTNMQVKCIEGICYGKAEIKDKGNYHLYAGSDFWTEISDWDSAHLALLDIFHNHAQNGLQDIKSFAKQAIVKTLIDKEISIDGHICWPNLVQFVDGKNAESSI